MANSDLQSVEGLSEAILENPSQPMLYAGRAYSYCELGQYQKAIEDYDEVLRLIHPNTDEYYAIALVNRGVLYTYLDEYQKAIEDYNEAIRITRSTALLYFYRGTAYQQTGEHRKAIEDYNEAIRFGGGKPEYHLARGASYRELGEDDNWFETRRTGQLDDDEQNPITLIAFEVYELRSWSWVFQTWLPLMFILVPLATLLAMGWVWLLRAPAEELWATAVFVGGFSVLGSLVVWAIDSRIFGVWDDEGSIIPGRIGCYKFLLFLFWVGVVAEIVIWIFFRDRMPCWSLELNSSWVNCGSI